MKNCKSSSFGRLGTTFLEVAITPSPGMQAQNVLMQKLVKHEDEENEDEAGGPVVDATCDAYQARLSDNLDPALDAGNDSDEVLPDTLPDHIPAPVVDATCDAYQAPLDPALDAHTAPGNDSDEVLPDALPDHIPPTSSAEPEGVGGISAEDPAEPKDSVVPETLLEDDAAEPKGALPESPTQAVVQEDDSEAKGFAPVASVVPGKDCAEAVPEKDAEGKFAVPEALAQDELELKRPKASAVVGIATPQRSGSLPGGNAVALSPLPAVVEVASQTPSAADMPEPVQSVGSGGQEDLGGYVCSSVPPPALSDSAIYNRLYRVIKKKDKDGNPVLAQQWLAQWNDLSEGGGRDQMKSTFEKVGYKADRGSNMC